MRAGLRCHRETNKCSERPIVNGIIYLVGLVVVVMVILSFLGMH
jgi:hypothetical protein